MNWFVMACMGFGFMVLTRWTSDKLDPFLIRIGAACFVGAGLIGVSGWLGQLLRTVTGWVTHTADQLGAAFVGTAVVWIAVLGVAFYWAGAMLPHKVFQRSFPDWLVVGGLLLPSLMTAVPGRLGEILRTGIEAAGHGATSLVGSLLGGA